MLTKTLPAAQFKKFLDIIGAEAPCPFEDVLTESKVQICEVDLVNSHFRSDAELRVRIDDHSGSMGVEPYLGYKMRAM